LFYISLEVYWDVLEKWGKVGGTCVAARKLRKKNRLVSVATSGEVCQTHRESDLLHATVEFPHNLSRKFHMATWILKITTKIRDFKKN
jgi:hypothetical protein